MPDAIFDHPRLAAVYDAFESPRDDIGAYIDICSELGARRIADVGCGTGSVAIGLAGRDCEVTGVDPADASLDVARTKPGAGAVSWIHGVARDLPAGWADVALMTGNVAQVFVTDEGWLTNLDGIHHGLQDKGFLVFETRRPERREWEEWIVDTQPTTLDVPGIGEVEQRFEVIAVELPLVSFRYTYRFGSDATTVTSDSTLRFRERDEVEQSLAVAGFSVLDVREAPDRPGAEYVFIAQRGTS